MQAVELFNNLQLDSEHILKVTAISEQLKGQVALTSGVTIEPLQSVASN